MKFNFDISLLLCVLLLAGCSSIGPRSSNDEAFVADALDHSKLFAYVRSVSKKAFFMIEADDPEYFEVAVGASTPARFERLGTIRVLKSDRSVLKQAYDDQGEEVWVDDVIRDAPPERTQLPSPTLNQTRSSCSSW